MTDPPLWREDGQLGVTTPRGNVREQTDGAARHLALSYAMQQLYRDRLERLHHTHRELSKLRELVTTDRHLVLARAALEAVLAVHTKASARPPLVLKQQGNLVEG